MKRFEELKAKRNELKEKARQILHEPDPFNTNNNIIYYNRYMNQAEEILKQMCEIKGIDYNEIK